MERMNRIGSEGSRRRVSAEIAATMAWPVPVVRKEVRNASGWLWETDKCEPVARAEIEARPRYSNDEHLRASFDVVGLESGKGEQVTTLSDELGDLARQLEAVHRKFGAVLHLYEIIVAAR